MGPLRCYLLDHVLYLFFVVVLILFETKGDMQISYKSASLCGTPAYL